MTGKKQNKKEKDWTDKSYFTRQDRKDLKEIKRLYEAGKYKEALDYASMLDTIVREQIPLALWKEIGGKLTRSGEEELKKLRERKGKSKSRGLSK